MAKKRKFKPGPKSPGVKTTEESAGPGSRKTQSLKSPGVKTTETTKRKK
jgi:hypothetical protein